MLIRLFAVLFLFVVTLGISLPVLPPLAIALGGDGFDVGLLYAIQSLGQFITAPLWGGFSDRIGRRWALTIALVCVATFEAATAFAPTLELLYACRFAAGLCAGTVVIGSSFAADVTTPETRAKGMAVVGISFGLGFTIGPAIGAITASLASDVVAPTGLGAPFLVATGCALLASVVAVAVIRDVKQRRPSSERRASISDVMRLIKIRDLRWLFALFFVYTFAASIMEGAFFLYMNDQYQFDQTQVGYVFAGLGVLTAIMQGGVGRMAKRIGEARMVRGGGLVVATTLIAAPFIKPLAGFLAMMSATTMGRAFVHPGILSLTSQASPSEDETGRVMGALQSSSSLGRIIGPALGGFCFRSVAPESPFWLAGAVFLVMIVVWVAIGPRYAKRR